MSSTLSGSNKSKFKRPPNTMTAHDQMRAMLDQLMGTGRDGQTGKDQVHFTDPKVCKSFLLNCCPHDILSATRMDIGSCPKIHDLALRADYRIASASKKFRYEAIAFHHLTAFIEDCDRRTEMAKKRLEQTQEKLGAEEEEKSNKIHNLAEQLQIKLAAAERLGEDGQVDESLKLMEEVEELRAEKQKLEEEYWNSVPFCSYQQQKLRVCPVCSAYLGVHDNDRRLADHFGGKLHLGFIQIREKLEEMRQKVQEIGANGPVEEEEVQPGGSNYRRDDRRFFKKRFRR